MERALFDWLVRYGTPVLFLAQVGGIFGLPIPDELLLTLAGVLMRRGQLSVAPTVAAAISGSIAGITLSYLLGRTVGLAALQRVFRSHEASLTRAQSWFLRFGHWLLTVGYFIPGVRHVTALAAGSSLLEFRTFATYAYPGAVLWSLTFLLAGYYAGDRWQEMASVVRGHLIIFGVSAAALLTIYLLVVRPRARRL
jgi:membrane protein DedA with SNARE-associated domain